MQLELNIEELLEQLNLAVESLNQSVNLITSEWLDIDNQLPLSEQIKQVENIVDSTVNIINNVQQQYSNINDILLNKINLVYGDKLLELRQQYLEEETDTPREAVDNIQRYLDGYADTGLLLSSLKFLKTLLPPTVEEIQEIPFEVARIEDDTLPIGEDVIEAMGENGTVLVVYEIDIVNGEEVKVEINREIIKEMIRQVVRVGTMEV